MAAGALIYVPIRRIIKPGKPDIDPFAPPDEEENGLPPMTHTGLDRPACFAIRRINPRTGEARPATEEEMRAAALQVPLWMRLPQGFPAQWRAALEANRDRLTGNQDLAPLVQLNIGLVKAKLAEGKK